MDFLKPFFDGSYAPHGYCLLWAPGLIWTHVISDLLIAAAYFSIPLALISLVRRRKDLEFSGVFVLFAVFILACGTSHLMSVWNLWHGDYGLEAVVKAITAAASVPTAIILWKLLPQALALPSPAALRTANADLAVMVTERDAALALVREEATQRQRAEDALLQAKKIEALGQLTGGIAHDFNNLLQAIAGNLELISKNRNAEEKVNRWLSNAGQAVDRGRRLTGQLLTFSRSQRIEARVIDAAALVDGMAELLRNSVGPTIELTIEANPGTCPVETDATQLELAILNLAINARDATPAGGKIEISVERGEQQVSIRVRDQGVGMPPDIAERALEPFFTTKGPGQGTGLGLSMAFGVAHAAGGTLTLDSRPGAGTTATIVLPLTGGAIAADPTATDDQDIPAIDRTLHILLVDDDDVVRHSIADLLEDGGHRVTVAADGKAAIAALISDCPDLLLCDFAMPGMNGAQVAESAIEFCPGLPVIFISGYANSDAIDAAVQGRSKVLTKPVDRRTLFTAIAEAVG